MPHTSLNKSKTESSQNSGFCPKRFLWLKRFGIAILFLFASLIVTRFAMIFYAEAKLGDLIEQHRKAGIPVFPEDYNAVPRIPDESNSVPLYEQAASNYTWPASIPEEIEAKEIIKPGFFNSYRKVAKEILKANTKLLDTITQTRSVTGTYWPRNFSSPLIAWDLRSGLEPYKDVNKILILSSLMAKSDGDHKAALNRIGDTLRMSRRLNEMPGGLGMLNSTRVFVLHAIDVLKVITPTLKISDKEYSQGNGKTAASTKEVKTVIDMLLDSESNQRYWRSAMYTEQAFIIDAANRRCHGDSNCSRLKFVGNYIDATGPLDRFILKPFWRMDEYRMVTRLNELASSTIDIDSVEAIRTSAISSESTSISSLTKPFSTDAYNTLFDLAVYVRIRYIASRRMAAIALAIRWYETENQKRPEKLVCCPGNLLI